MNFRNLFVLLVFPLIFFSCSYIGEGKNKMVDAESIIKIINKDKPVQIHDKIIMGDLDFTSVSNSSLGDGISIYHRIPNDVVFVKCVFMGKVHSFSKKEVDEYCVFNQNISFIQCDFRQEVDFSNMEIGENMNFSNSIFRNIAYFNNISVLGTKSHFWEMSAEKAFYMSNCSFNGNMNLMDASFSSSPVSFSGLKCVNLQLGNIKCNASFDLSNSLILGNLSMNYSTFGNTFSMIGSHLLGSFDVHNSSFNGNVDLTNSKIDGKACISGVSFLSTISNKGFLLSQNPDIENSKFREKCNFDVLSKQTIKINE